MNCRVVILVAVFAASTLVVSDALNPDIGNPLLPVPHLIAIQGYNVQTHEVFTEDGAILEMYQIRGHKNQTELPSKGSVLLLPGVSMSAYSWVLQPKESLAYYLVDRGYEVWVANLRGQAPMEQKFLTQMLGPKKWRFTQDDMATYDMPAMIDYIRATSLVAQVHVVGYSLGNTVMVQLLADKPEYNSRVASLTVMGPSIYVRRNTGPIRFFNFMPFGTFLLHGLVVLSGFGAVPLAQPILEIGGFFGSILKISKVFVELLFQLETGFDPRLTKDIVPPFLLRETPAPSLILLQYFQASNSGSFTKFDYGKALNLKKYGQPAPPVYDLTKIKTPILYMTAPSDGFDSYEDTKYALDQFIRGGSLYKYLLIKGQFFGHVSFVLNRGINEKVNKPLYVFLEDIRRGIPLERPYTWDDINKIKLSRRLLFP